jgi:hypothetical protein
VMAAASLAKMLTAARGQAAAPPGPAAVSSPAQAAADDTGSR